MPVSTSERRHRNRYPLELDLEYRVFTKGHSIVFGSARTVNISSEGALLLPSTEDLKKGQLMALSIRWDTALHAAQKTTLEILGRVTRVDSSGVAIRFLRYGLHPLRRQEMQSALV